MCPIATPHEAEAQPAPNVIYIMTDDLGPGDFSVYNNLQGMGNTSRIPTPNIDAMAANGMTFTNAHSPTSLCAPTRASVMTGAPQWQTGTRWGIGADPFQNGQQTVGQLMQNAGYNTGFVGKGHLGGRFYQVGSNNTVGGGNTTYNNINNLDFDRPIQSNINNFGFDYSLYTVAGIQARPYVFFEDGLATDVDRDGNTSRITNANKNARMRNWSNGYDDGITEIDAGGLGSTNWRTRDVPEAMTQRSIDFMRDSVNNANEPFYLHYMSVAGHWPYTPMTEFRVDVNGDGDRNDPGESYTIDGYDGTGPAPDGLGFETMQMVNVADAEVGALTAFLENTPDPRNPGHMLIDNTVIIFTSDNGGIGEGYDPRHGDPDDQELDVYGHQSTAGLRNNKGSIYEGGHRVPFIVRWGDEVEAGAVRDQQVSNIDLMGTLAGITGQSLIDQGEGSYNLTPVLLGQRDDSDPIRDSLIAEHISGQGNLRGNVFIQDGWKLLVNRSNTTDPNVLGFFDLNTDPAETSNLENSSNPQVQARLSAMYNAYLTERNANRTAPVFIGRNSAATASDVAGWGDVEVEGTFTGNQTLNGDLDANVGATIRIADASAATASVSLSPTQDIRIEDITPDTNHNTGRISVGRDSEGQLQRTALEYDIAGALPSGAVIESAEIKLTVGFAWGSAQSDDPTIEVHRLLSDFNEAQADWNNASTGNAWSTPGGDFDAAVLATGDGFNPDTVGSGTELSLSGVGLTSDVIANLNNGAYQLFLKYDDASENSGLVNAMWIDSNNRGTAPAQLIINYTALALNQFTVNGNYTQRDGATLEIGFGSAYDRLAIVGDASLAGTLNLAQDAGFTPAMYQTLDILTAASRTGTFDELQGVVLSDTTGLAVTYSADAVHATAAYRGDADLDNDIDGTDFFAVVNNFTGSGQTGSQWAAGDFDGDGDADGTDFFTVVNNFSGSGVSPAAAAFLAQAADPNNPDLIYNPDTGEVTLHTDGVFFDTYQLLFANGGDFDDAAAQFAFQSFFAGGTTDLVENEIFESNPTGAFLAITNGGNDTFSLGLILPTGLDDAQLAALFEAAQWSDATNASGSFDLIRIPEPTTATLLAAAGLLTLRRRRIAA